MNFVNYASANRRERLNPPERLMIRSERLIGKQKKLLPSSLWNIYIYIYNILQIRWKQFCDNPRPSFRRLVVRNVDTCLSWNNTVKGLTNAHVSRVVNVATSRRGQLSSNFIAVSPNAPRRLCLFLAPTLHRRAGKKSVFAGRFLRARVDALIPP